MLSSLMGKVTLNSSRALKDLKESTCELFSITETEALSKNTVIASAPRT